MEEEDKINIEEATVNLSCVKKELEEFEFVENRYRIALTYENIFGDTLEEKRKNIDSLIGFLDDDVIMETEMGTIKLEDVKDEDRRRKIIEQSSCNKCCGNYEGYCSNCSSISHILNNVTPNINLQSDLNTIPIGILEIREISMRSAVFALKTIPEGVILGPFEGIAPIKGMNGLKWKIKNKKFINDQNANWMKYIKSVANPLSKNLDIFQFEGLLYFETSREIQEGEELLVCYCEEKEVLKSENDDESYLVPVVKEKFSKVFACVLCCLGFCLEQCLVEHKSKCPQGDHGSSIEDFEIIQCQYCKVWLEKQEHLKGHKLYCQDNYKSCRNTNLSDFAHTNIDDEEKVHENDEIITSTVTNENRYKCLECFYQTNRKHMLKRHINTHGKVKPFQCDIYGKQINQKHYIKRHIKDIRLYISSKEYKCSECSFQTKYKANLKMHLNTHTDIKRFQCDICKKKFNRKDCLKLHLDDEHLYTSDKKYKCSDCSYQTNIKNNLKKHLYTHNDIKSFGCDICKKKFSQKSYLQRHIRTKHSNTNGKQSGIKSFQCNLCKNYFRQKCYLKRHIKNMHSNTSEKEHKCYQCSYQTKFKGNLKIHLGTHNEIKSFQCNVCKNYFNQKCYLELHIKDKHSNTSEKEHKCSECSYQTNYKGNLKTHIRTHRDVQLFQCNACHKIFKRKCNLHKHICQLKQQLATPNNDESS